MSLMANGMWPRLVMAGMLVVSLLTIYFLPSPAAAADESATKTLWKALGAANTADTLLYGQVVDQDGNPIENAWVRFAGGSDFFAKSNGTFEVYTDADGRFNTAGGGGSGLLIDNIRKTGYQWQARLKGGIYFDNFKRFPDSLLWSDYSSEDNPYIFRLLKTAGEGKVLAWKGSFSLGGEKPELRVLDFKCADYSGRCKITAANDEVADIKVSSGRDGYDWWLRIEAVNGGVHVADPQRLYEAPEDGYRPYFEFSGTWDGIWSNLPRPLKPRIHFYSQGGKYFGLLELSIDAYASPAKRGAEGYRIIVRYKSLVNIDGSRNLTKKASSWDY